MIRIFGPEESKKYMTSINNGFHFDYNGHTADGVYMHNYYEAVSKEMVEKALVEIGKIFPLHWANVDIFCLPMVLMLRNEISKEWTGTIYLGRSWHHVIILGARVKPVSFREVASTLLHELAHEFTYEFIDTEPFDLKDTEQYKKFKELAGITNFKELSPVWEDRPTEVLAETIRYYCGLENDLFNDAPYIVFDSTNDPKPSRQAFEYLMSLIPEKEVTEVKDYFKDDNGKWHEEFNNRLAEKGIVEGYEDGTVKADNNITRGEVNKIVSEAIDFVLDKVKEIIDEKK